MQSPGDTQNLIQYDTQGRIDEELPCVRCAYNLYRSQPDGTCPECGALVHDTVRLAKLRGFDPKWLKRIAGALILVAISAGLMSGLYSTVVALIILGFWSIPLSLWYRKRFLEAAKMAL